MTAIHEQITDKIRWQCPHCNVTLSCKTIEGGSESICPSCEVPMTYPLLEECSTLDLKGLSRLGFWVVWILLLVSSRFIYNNLVQHGSSVLGVWIAFAILTTVACSSRLKNAALSSSSAYLCLIPVLNIIPLVNALSCQKGFGITKKLDRLGKIAVLICWSPVIIILILMCVSWIRALLSNS